MSGWTIGLPTAYDTAKDRGRLGLDAGVSVTDDLVSRVATGILKTRLESAIMAGGGVGEAAKICRTGLRDKQPNRLSEWRATGATSHVSEH